MTNFPASACLGARRHSPSKSISLIRDAVLLNLFPLDLHLDEDGLFLMPEERV